MPMASKAYILRIDKPLSKEYAEVCANSCDSVGLPWVYFDGFYDMTGRAAWLKTGIKMKFSEPSGKNPSSAQEKAVCCSAGHAAIWKAIAEGEDGAAIVLEHDAIMLHPMNLDIPDNVIVTLGYKLPNPSSYDHIKAGPPNQLFQIDGHEGAHAYAITKNTAKFLVEEIEDRGVLGCVDNAYFLHKQRKSKVGLMIVSPTPAIGWIRESTIWNKSSNRNSTFIRSFRDHIIDK
jgi:hypothetical protein